MPSLLTSAWVERATGVTRPTAPSTPGPCPEEAEVVLDGWFRLVDLVGRGLADGLAELDRGDPPAAAATLQRVQLAAEVAAVRLDPIAGSGTEIGGFAARLAADVRTIAAVVVPPASADEIRRALAGLSFDSRAFGRWLRVNCPGLADDTVSRLDGPPAG